MERRWQRHQRPEVTRRTLTLSPLLGLVSPRTTTRRSWSPQHQSSLEAAAPRQVQSARNSLSVSLQQHNSVEVIFCCLPIIIDIMTVIA